MADIAGTLLVILLLFVAVVYIINMIPGLRKALGCLEGDKSPFCMVLDTAGFVTGASWVAKKVGITRKAGEAEEAAEASEASEAGTAAAEAGEAGAVAAEAGTGALAVEGATAGAEAGSVLAPETAGISIAAGAAVGAGTAVVAHEWDHVTNLFGHGHW